jgi:anti-anti-sigma regulatory factor
MTTALSTQPHSGRQLASIHRIAARYTAPARFDTHAVDAFDAWVAEHAADRATLTVDMSAVVFIDLYAIEALDAAEARLAGARGELSLESLSVAARITFELLAGRPAELAMAA